MRVNLNIIRSILIQVADCESPYGINSKDLKFEGASNTLIGFHVRLLIDESMLKGYDACTKVEPYNYVALQLTLPGSNLLSKIENDTVWDKVRAVVLKGASVTSIAALEGIATKVINSFS